MNINNSAHSTPHSWFWAESTIWSIKFYLAILKTYPQKWAPLPSKSINCTLKIFTLMKVHFSPSKSAKCTLTILYPQKIAFVPSKSKNVPSKRIIFPPSENELPALKIVTFDPQNFHFRPSKFSFLTLKIFTSHPQNVPFHPSENWLLALKMVTFDPYKSIFVILSDYVLLTSEM